MPQISTLLIYKQIIWKFVLSIAYLGGWSDAVQTIRKMIISLVIILYLESRPVDIKSYSWILSLSGLPALYSPYELRLLVDKGYAVLVEKNFSQPPSEEIKQQYKNILAVNSVAIVEYARQNRMEESMKVIDKIIAGKRKKCTAKGLNPDEITVDSVIAEMRDNFKFNPDQMTIEVPMAEPFEVPTKWSPNCRTSIRWCIACTFTIGNLAIG